MKLMFRFTDDMLIFWEKSKDQPDDWNYFKLCLNRASNLSRECEELGEEVVILDLKFWIYRQGNKFMRDPCTKKESIFLYLLPHSDLSKGALKGVVHGFLRKNLWKCYRVEDRMVEV